MDQRHKVKDDPASVGAGRGAKSNASAAKQEQKHDSNGRLDEQRASRPPHIRHLHGGEFAFYEDMLDAVLASYPDGGCPTRDRADLIVAEVMRLNAEMARPLSEPELFDWIDNHEKVQFVPPRLPCQCTDLGNAKLYGKQHRTQVKFVHPWGKWLTWNGCRWAVDDVGVVERLAKETIIGMYPALAEIDSDDARKQFAKWAIQSQDSKRVWAMITRARSEPGVPILPDQLDTDPMLLNCANGLLHLPGCHFEPHDRGRFITRLCPTPYEPTARCTRWLTFLDEVFDGDLDVIEWLRRFLGYSLTGDVSEHVLPIFWGKGANGKSTLLRTVQTMLGPDYAITAAPDLLLKKWGTHPTEMADLCGRRFVVCMESDDSRQLAPAVANKITGGDRIRARRMREDHWEFAPTHKIVLCCNHKPTVRDTSDGIWRRLRLVPFERQFKPNEQDKGLPEKLQDELPGILAWCVAGCQAWDASGLTEPAAIQAATQSYRSGEDTVSRFVDDQLVFDPNCMVKASGLYSCYRMWCGQIGEEPLTQRGFGEAIRDSDQFQQAGVTRRRSNGWCYHGVGLDDKPLPDPD